jgi:superfamily I DNA and/or RNA helicase
MHGLLRVISGRPERLPRGASMHLGGTEFLFNPNRLNVAISRAQSLAIVVHGSQLLDGAWNKIDDLRRLNLFAHGEEISEGA